MSSTRGSFAESRQKTRTWPGGRRASAGQTRAASAALVKPGLPPKKRKSALVATSEVRGRGTVVLKKRESERRVGTPSPSGFFSRGVFSLSAWAHRCLLSISTGGSLEMTKTGKGEKYLKQAFITDKVDGHRPQAWASKRKKQSPKYGGRVRTGRGEKWTARLEAGCGVPRHPGEYACVRLLGSRKSGTLLVLSTPLQVNAFRKPQQGSRALVLKD